MHQQCLLHKIPVYTPHLEKFLSTRHFYKKKSVDILKINLVESLDADIPVLASTAAVVTELVDLMWRRRS